MAKRAEAPSAPFLPGFESPPSTERPLPAVSRKVLQSSPSPAPIDRRRYHDTFESDDSFNSLGGLHFEKTRTLLQTLHRDQPHHVFNGSERSASALWKLEELALESLDAAKVSQDHRLVKELRLALLRIGYHEQLTIGSSIQIGASEAVKHRLEAIHFYDRWVQTQMPSPHEVDPEDVATREALQRKLHARHECLNEVADAIKDKFPFRQAAERLVGRMEEVYREAWDLFYARLDSSKVHARKDIQDLIRLARQKHPPSSVAPSLIEAIRQVDRLRLMRDHLYYLLLAA